MTPSKTTKNSLHFCFKCNKSYKTRHNLLVHDYHIHSGQGEIKVHACSKCDKSYARSSSLSSHMNSQHSSIIHKCSQCQLVDLKKASLFYLLRIQDFEEQVLRSSRCFFCKKTIEVNLGKMRLWSGKKPTNNGFLICPNKSLPASLPLYTILTFVIVIVKVLFI